MTIGKIALERAKKAATAVIIRLAPYCKRIETVGSVRRKRSWVNDIDFVLIPSGQWNLSNEIKKLGSCKVAGQKLMRVIASGIQLDFYFATEETWATLLLIRTGSKENNIRLATIAKKRGWRLAASGDGLFNAKGDRVAGDTEASIYQALGLRYQHPEERG